MVATVNLVSFGESLVLQNPSPTCIRFGIFISKKSTTVLILISPQVSDFDSIQHAAQKSCLHIEKKILSFIILQDRY